VLVHDEMHEMWSQLGLSYVRSNSARFRLQFKVDPVQFMHCTYLSLRYTLRYVWWISLDPNKRCDIFSSYSYIAMLDHRSPCPNLSLFSTVLPMVHSINHVNSKSLYMIYMHAHVHGNANGRTFATTSSLQTGFNR
jgi:transcription elongation factor GreA-like protein